MRYVSSLILCVLLSLSLPGLSGCNLQLIGQTTLRSNSNTGSGGGGGSTGPTVDPSALVKLTPTAPLIQAPAPASNDCGRYLMGMSQESWVPMTFHRNDGTLVFSIPCKYSDGSGGGWHIAFADWDWTAATGTWMDFDGGTAGNQEKLSRFTLIHDGVTAFSNHFTLALNMLPSGELYGIGFRYQTAAYRSLPVYAADFNSLAVSSFATAGSADLHRMTLNDGSFKGSTVNSFDILHEGGVFYVYNTTRNAPTNDQYYLSISTSSDLVTMTEPTAPLKEGYAYAFVDKDAFAYHMVAYNTVAGRWEYIPGTSPTTWDFDAAVDLNLRSHIGTGGAWDADLYQKLNASEPFLSSARVEGGKLYIFYRAGAMDYTAGTAPYSSPRGIGVFRVDIDY